VRDEETGPHRPGVGGEAVRATHTGKIIAIDNRETQAEFLRQLILPLGNHGRRRRHDDKVYPPSQQHLAQDEPSLDGFAEAHIVGDQEVHPRQLERLGERQELIGIEPDTGPERGLKEVPVGGGGGLPGDRAHVRSEHLRIIGSFTPDLLPKVVLDQANIDLAL
jgi:hypothetical protein